MDRTTNARDWARRSIAAGLLAVSAFLVSPNDAKAAGDEGGDGSCTAGKVDGEPKCCSCRVVGEGRDFEVKDCSRTGESAYSACHNGTDESAPPGTCGGSCEIVV